MHFVLISRPYSARFEEGGGALKADLSECSLLFKKDASDARRRRRSGYKATDYTVFLVEKIESF
jgi:hypothetical protein